MSLLPRNRMIEMTIGIIVGCMPAVAALVRHRGLPFSRLFSSILSRIQSARVSAWSWIEGGTKSSSSDKTKETICDRGDLTLRGQRVKTRNRSSEDYVELIEARQGRE